MVESVLEILGCMTQKSKANRIVLRYVQPGSPRAFGHRQPHGALHRFGRSVVGGHAHNPHKNPRELMGQAHRLQMVHLAVSENEKLKSDVEFDLPQPNFTAATMRHLRAQYPDVSSASSSGRTICPPPHVAGPLGIGRKPRILVYPRRTSDAPSPVPPPAQPEDLVPRSPEHSVV